jgi:hypothetical protein
MFTPIHLDIPCVLFFKTRPPLDPVDFVHRICQEVVSNPDIRKMRYINRLTPMTLIGRATERGLEDVAKTVLSQHFQLTAQDNHKNCEGNAGNNEEGPTVAARPSVSFASPSPEVAWCATSRPVVQQELCSFWKLPTKSDGIHSLTLQSMPSGRPSARTVLSTGMLSSSRLHRRFQTCIKSISLRRAKSY